MVQCNDLWPWDGQKLEAVRLHWSKSFRQMNQRLSQQMKLWCSPHSIFHQILSSVLLFANTQTNRNVTPFFQIQPKFLFRILSAVQLDGKLFYQRFLNLVPISKTSLKAASWRRKTFWSTKGDPPSKDWYICQIFLFMACLYNQRFMPQLLSIIEILVNFKFYIFVNFKFVFLKNPKWSNQQIQELTQSLSGIIKSYRWALSILSKVSKYI